MLNHRAADLLIELFRFRPLFLFPRFELNRITESHCNLTQPRPACPHGEYIEGPLQICRNDRTPRLRYNHPEPSFGRPEMAIVAASTFREYDHGITCSNQVDRLSKRLSVEAPQPHRYPAQCPQNSVQYRNRKQVVPSQVPGSSTHPAAEQRNIEIAGMICGDQHPPGLRNLTFDTIPKANPSNDSYQNPQNSIDYPAHDPVDTATIICSTTWSGLRAEVSMSRASPAGTNGSTERVRSRRSRSDRSLNVVSTVPPRPAPTSSLYRRATRTSASASKKIGRAHV